MENRKKVIDMHLSYLILDRIKFRGESRFFKSVGMAAFNLYGAKLVYENLF
jgi:ornithine cyclodeaminase/alanine dehydrogenase-like protein (mu-crystallin family)